MKMSMRWTRIAPTLTCIGAFLLLLSWMLSSGDGAAERVLCRSESPAPCILTNRPGGKPAVLTLHLSLHSTKTDTAYVGSIQIASIANFSTGGPEQFPEQCVRNA